MHVCGACVLILYIYLHGEEGGTDQTSIVSHNCGGPGITRIASLYVLWAAVQMLRIQWGSCGGSCGGHVGALISHTV